jgi:hypothetical protein
MSGRGGIVLGGVAAALAFYGRVAARSLAAVADQASPLILLRHGPPPAPIAVRELRRFLTVQLSVPIRLFLTRARLALGAVEGAAPSSRSSPASPNAGAAGKSARTTSVRASVEWKAIAARLLAAGEASAIRRAGSLAMGGRHSPPAAAAAPLVLRGFTRRVLQPRHAVSGAAAGAPGMRTPAAILAMAQAKRAGVGSEAKASAAAGAARLASEAAGSRRSEAAGPPAAILAMAQAKRAGVGSEAKASAAGRAARRGSEAAGSRRREAAGYAAGPPAPAAVRVPSSMAARDRAGPRQTAPSATFQTGGAGRHGRKNPPLGLLRRFRPARAKLADLPTKSVAAGSPAAQATDRASASFARASIGSRAEQAAPPTPPSFAWSAAAGAVPVPMTVRRPQTAASAEVKREVSRIEHRIEERIERHTTIAAPADADALSPRLLRSLTDHVCRAVARQTDVERYRRGR